MELLLVIQSKAFWVIFQSSVEVKHHRGYKKKRISESDLTVQQILFVQFLIVSYARTTGARMAELLERTGYFTNSSGHQG